MGTCGYYPYLSAAVRDSCLAYLDSVAAAEWPVSSESLFIPTTYGATFVRVSGPKTGAPLMLLHGAGATSLMWKPNIERLSSEFRTFAVDQIAELGHSVCTRPVEKLDDFVVWLNDLFDGLGLSGGVNLAGLSYGGALAAQYALRFPDRLNRLVLLAPGKTVLRLSAGFVFHLALFMVSGKGVQALVRWMFADMARKDPVWVHRVIEELAMHRRSLQRRHVPIPPVLTDEEWKSLRVPTLFLVGEHEVIYSPRRATDRLKRVAPRVTAEIIPGAGHDLSFAQADLVNERMVAFLRQG